MAGSLAHPRHSGLGGRAGSATFRAVARWLHLRGQGSASRPGAARVREGSGQPVMTQPATGTRDSGDQPRSAVRQAVAAPAGAPPLLPEPKTVAAPAGPLPPGQYVPRTLPVLHYGPIPVFHPGTWDLRIFGSTAAGEDTLLSWQDLGTLPVREVIADFHCVTKFTVPAVRWAGVAALELLRRFPPAAAVTHVMIWADFGYSANVRITDFAAEGTLLATHRDGTRLSPEHGYPLRLVVPHLYAWKSVKWVRAIEYLTMDRRGFWEER